MLENGRNGRSWTVNNFSNNLYLLRHYYGLKRKELAAKLHRDESSVSRFESGKSTPKIEELARIAGVLGTNSGRLLDIDSGAYLQSRNLLMFLNRDRYLEYPPGEVLRRNPQIVNFIEQSFFQI